ncbi:hypothetical protein [Fusobacterium sp. PH5-44]|uniref:hypothetical protein n=1 Tax=unclassified Fusobacterium TaxID=2648384 RepID=UPI003D25A47D
MNKYYWCVFILNKVKYYCLWCSKSEEFFKSEEKLIYFTNMDDMRKMIKLEKLVIGEGIAEYDCERLEKYGKNYFIPPAEILDFWNILTDISLSLNVDFLGNERNKSIDKIHSKLFYGCNLPTVTPENMEYIPIWGKKEVKKIKRIIEDGISILRRVFIPN